MDLAAFADIERLGALARANGIDVPSLRGYRLMSKEEPWDDGIISREENALIGIYWHTGCHGVGPDFDFDCTMEDFIDGYRPAHVPRSRVPKEFRDCLGPTLTVFDKVSMARARWHRQAMLWNRYAGKEGVLYIHSRMGGTGRARGDYYKDGEVFWHKGWDVRDQPWFLDVCADAFDPTYCDIYARIKESERMTHFWKIQRMINDCGSKDVTMSLEEKRRDKEPKTLELKPCPFCGCIPRVIERAGMCFPWAIDHGAGRLDYHCPLDYLVLTNYSSEDRAISHWNRRASE